MPSILSIRPRSTPPGDHPRESAPDPLYAFLLPAGLLTGLVAALYFLQAPPAIFWAAIFLAPFLLILLMEV